MLGPGPAKVHARALLVQMVRRQKERGPSDSRKAKAQALRQDACEGREWEERSVIYICRSATRRLVADYMPTCIIHAGLEGSHARTPFAAEKKKCAERGHRSVAKGPKCDTLLHCIRISVQRGRHRVWPRRVIKCVGVVKMRTEDGVEMEGTRSVGGARTAQCGSATAAV